MKAPGPKCTGAPVGSLSPPLRVDWLCKTSEFCTNDSHPSCFRTFHAMVHKMSTRRWKVAVSRKQPFFLHLQTHHDLSFPKNTNKRQKTTQQVQAGDELAKVLGESALLADLGPLLRIKQAGEADQIHSCWVSGEW